MLEKGIDKIFRKYQLPVFGAPTHPTGTSYLYRMKFVDQTCIGTAAPVAHPLYILGINQTIAAEEGVFCFLSAVTLTIIWGYCMV